MERLITRFNAKNANITGKKMDILGVLIGHWTRETLKFRLMDIALMHWRKRMRLIDADKFKKDILDLANEAHFEPRELHFSTSDMVSNIESRETVDSIPVKFIFRCMLEAPELTKHAYQILINEWRSQTK